MHYNAIYIYNAIYKPYMYIHYYPHYLLLEGASPFMK